MHLIKIHFLCCQGNMQRGWYLWVSINYKRSKKKPITLFIHWALRTDWRNPSIRVWVLGHMGGPERKVRSWSSPLSLVTWSRLSTALRLGSQAGGGRGDVASEVEPPIVVPMRRSATPSLSVHLCLREQLHRKATRSPCESSGTLAETKLFLFWSRKLPICLPTITTVLASGMLSWFPTHDMCGKWQPAAMRKTERKKKRWMIFLRMFHKRLCSCLDCFSDLSHWSWEGQALYAAWMLWMSPSPSGGRCCLGNNVGLGRITSPLLVPEVAEVFSAIGENMVYVFYSYFF